MAIEDRPATTLLDHFASGLARTGDPVRAARSLGQDVRWARARMAELCELLNVPIDPRDDVQ